MRIKLHRTIAVGLAASLAWQGVFPGAAFARAPAAEILKIDINESAHSTFVDIHGRGLKKYQTVVLREPTGARPPKIILSFPDTMAAPTLQGTKAGSGSVDEVDVSVLGDAASPTTQILIGFAADTAYRVKKSNDNVSIEIDKAAEPAAAAADASSSVKVQNANNIIQAGDMLYLSVSPADELSRELTVDQNGKISLPLIGTIQVSGLTPDAMAHKISGLLSRYVTNPRVDVLIRQFSSQQVSLMGQVRNPGSFNFRQNLRLLDVISMAGGFAPSANKTQIRVYRGSGASRKVTVFDATQSIKSGDVTKDFLLQAGDLIEVPQGVNPLTVFGEVSSPGTYEYYHDMRLLDLIALTHGFRDGANYRKVTIFRGEAPHQTVIRVRFTNVLDGHMRANILLEPGDVVFVPTRALWEYSTVAATIGPIITVVLAAATVFLAAKK